MTYFALQAMSWELRAQAAEIAALAYEVEPEPKPGGRSSIIHAHEEAAHARMMAAKYRAQAESQGGERATSEGV